MPKVSVIVPNYNHAEYLKQRIDSILLQTYQDFELIILDDCSTDCSKDIIESYRGNPHISHIVYNEKNGGSPFAQWNKGIELASGEWIWIAESDDWAEPSFLKEMLREIDNWSNCGLAYSKARYIQNGKELWHIKETNSVTEYTGEDFVRKHLLFANSIYNVSMVLFRKSLFNLVNQDLYNDMNLCGDWLFYSQLCQYTNILEVDKYLSNYRVHDNNTSKKNEHEGMSFIEGIRVLDYLTNHFNVNHTRYKRFWGRQWYKYSKKYFFSKETEISITSLYRKAYPGICFWNKIYKIKGSI